MINFGNITSEEESRVFFLIPLNLYLFTWWQLIQKTGQLLLK